MRPGAGTIGVIAADHERLYLDGVVAAIEGHDGLRLAGRYDAAVPALEACARLGPDVAVVGLRDAESAQFLAGLSVPTSVVLVSDPGAPRAVSTALEAGVSAFLTRATACHATMVAAIAAAAEGSIFLDQAAQRSLAVEARGRRLSVNPLLTAREVQVLKLLATGQSASGIAESLIVGTATIRTHLAHVYEKLGVSNRAAAVAEGMRRGLVE